MKPRAPQTYDEITRKTVLDPDGSVRPGPEEAASGARDLELRAVVADALLASGLTAVGIEVEHGRIILRGWVRDADLAMRAVRVAAAVAPDAEVVNRMHVGIPT